MSETAWSGETWTHTTVGRTCTESTAVKLCSGVHLRLLAEIVTGWSAISTCPQTLQHTPSPASGGGVQVTSLVRTSFNGRWAHLPQANTPSRNIMPAPGLQSRILGISCILCLWFAGGSTSAGTTSLHSWVGWGMGLPAEPAARQPVKKFPAVYTIPRFITVFTAASYSSVSSD
jgi:hypothetical protein